MCFQRGLWEQVRNLISDLALTYYSFNDRIKRNLFFNFIKMSYFLILFPWIALWLLIYYVFLQYKLAKKLNYPKPWFAFIPIVNIIQIFEMGGLSPLWLFINFVPLVWPLVFLYKKGEAFFCISEKVGQRKIFGILLFVPFLNYWAMWKLIQSKSFAEEDLNNTEIIKIMISSLNQGISESELRNAALEEWASEEEFNILFKKALLLKNQNWSFEHTADNRVKVRTIWTLFFTFIITFFLILFILGGFIMSGFSKNIKAEIGRTNFDDIEIIFSEIPAEKINYSWDKDWEYNYILKNKKYGQLIAKYTYFNTNSTLSWDGQILFLGNDASGNFIISSGLDNGEIIFEMKIYDCFDIVGDCEEYLDTHEVSPLKVFKKKFIYEKDDKVPLIIE